MNPRTIDIKGERHYVWNGLERFTSVTTAIGGMPKPKLNEWKLKKLIEDMMLHWDAVKGKKPADALEYIRERDVSSSADTGNLVHKYVDSIGKGFELPDGDDITSSFYGQVHNFIDEYRPTFIENELFVFNREWGYGGRIDTIIEIHGVRYVLDVKTGTRVYSDVGLQLAAYANATTIGRPDGTEEPMLDVNKRTGLVLHVRPDMYQCRQVDIGDRVYQHFLSAVDCYNWGRAESDNIIGDVLPIGD